MYEYKVIPTPERAQKVKGLKRTADRFAHTLAERINAEASGGWQFVRAETLPCEERGMLGSVRQTSVSMLVFARPLGQVRPDAMNAMAAVQEPVAVGPELGAPERPTASIQPVSDQLAAVPRREPLFRPNLLRDGPARHEPVLRPRRQPGDGAED